MYRKLTRCSVPRLFFLFLCLVFLSNTCFAARHGLSGLITFRDEYQPTAISARDPSEYTVKPWSEREKRKLHMYLQLIKDKLPGIVQRATAYRPILLYRATMIPSGDASAFSYNHSITFSDTVIHSMLDPDSSPIMTHTVAHELTHLADPFNKIAWSEEWVNLVKPRIDRVQRTFLKRRGLPVGKAIEERRKRPNGDLMVNEITELATQQGLPSGYASVNLVEALAEYVAVPLTYGYVPPVQIKGFIESKLLSTPVVLDPSIRYVHQGLANVQKGQLDKAIRAFDRAIKLDPDLVRAQEYRAQVWALKKKVDHSISDYTQAVRKFWDIGGVTDAHP